MNNYKQLIDNNLNDLLISIAVSQEEQDLLKYIFVGGKRLRPMIALAIGNSFNDEKFSKELIQVALGIEIIHNASLIIDDLPCMDNDLWRRGQATVHHKYGQTVALQVALKLMTIATDLILKSVVSVPNSTKKVFLFNRILYENLGSGGLPLGQYLDLNYLKRRLELENNRKTHQDLIYKKTTTLFNLSFLLSYCLFEEDLDRIAKMEKASKWFGLAFQIYDDFDDIGQDTDHCSPNFVVKFGRTEAYNQFHKSVNKTLEYLGQLGIELDFFNEIFDKLKKQVQL